MSRPARRSPRRIGRPGTCASSCRSRAGGAADTAARLYGEALSQTFGKQFVIENRPGGGGIPVAEAIARAEPDGYTLMVSGIPIIVVGPAMNKNVGYDPMRDLTHIAYFGGTPNMLAVHRSLGIKTYAEFLAYARKQPTGTDYVSAGFGTMGNWKAEYLATLENIKLNHIAYKGGSQAIVDLIAGHVKAVGADLDRDRPACPRRHARRAGGDVGQPAGVSARHADLPRARPQGLRVADLVLAVGAAEAAARHRRARSTR